MRQLGQLNGQLSEKEFTVRAFHKLLEVHVYTWLRDNKTFFMLNSAEHDFFPAHKC